MQIGSVFMNDHALVSDFGSFNSHDDVLAILQFYNVGKRAIFSGDLDLLYALALDEFNADGEFPFGQSQPKSPVTTVTGSAGVPPVGIGARVEP